MPRDHDAEAEGGSAALRFTKHPNAWRVSPLWHGDGCMGLSGLYAALNGIRLSLAHEHVLTAGEAHSLLRAGARFLDGRMTVQQSLANGMRVQLWQQLVAAMTETAGRMFSVRLVAERLHCAQRSREAAFEALEQAVRTLRVPMLLCRGGRYTAVSGVTNDSLVLFDSGYSYWISKRVCGVPGDGSEARHVIYPTSLMALAL